MRKHNAVRCSTAQAGARVTRSNSRPPAAQRLVRRPDRELGRLWGWSDRARVRPSTLSTRCAHAVDCAPSPNTNGKPGRRSLCGTCDAAKPARGSPGEFRARGRRGGAHRTRWPTPSNLRRGHPAPTRDDASFSPRLTWKFHISGFAAAIGNFGNCALWILNTFNSSPIDSF